MDTAIEQTWQELGFSVRPLGRKIFCRILPKRSHTAAGIEIPSTLLSFYHGPAHLQILEAKVLAIGPNVKGVQKGDIICFQRLYFARIWDLKDGTKGGWIDQAQILGYGRESIGNQTI